MKKNNQMKPDNVANVYGHFYRAHHVYYRAACRAGKGAGGCADSGKNDLYGI